MKNIIPTISIIALLSPVLFLQSVVAQDDPSLVPKWIKHNALWWSQGQISDDDFINGMRWLVENRIIPVEDLVETMDGSTVPDSVKKIAYSWSQGNLPDVEFIHGIEYLIKNGVIELDNHFVAKITQERLDQVSVRNETRKSVIIIPVFTASAYTEHGFYSYYEGKCNLSCLTSILYTQIPLGYTASGKAVDTLGSLGYYTLTDIDVDKNPDILLQYGKVIVLHNEYVTQKEFDAITTHPHVVYLYPNALYGKISVDYHANLMTLVRGHNYPDSKIRNGFDWKFDNSQFEYDTQCSNWKFQNVSNGIMLDCYPENHLEHNTKLLKAIKDF
ncbi:MAG TPA: hypothetical protein VFX64_08055 [Candidatus Nitrosotalea sp.]|nr:hypothetical protein [Candidatus Nitrosotalea sp.]